MVQRNRDQPVAGSAAPEVPGHPYTLLGVTESPTAGPGGVPRADDADSDVPRYRYTAELAARLERTWQENWARLGTFNVPNPVGSLAPPDGAAVPDDKLFVQDMFPYPRVRTPRWSSPRLHRDRRLCPLFPDGGP